MNKNILIQYNDIQEEVKDLRKRICRIENKIKKMESDGNVKDSVACGKKGKKPLRTVKITGFPLPEYTATKNDLQTRKLKLEYLENELRVKLNEVDDFIDNLEDSRIRRILRYRYIDEMSWDEVAINIGRKATADSVRKEHDRYFINI